MRLVNHIVLDFEKINSKNSHSYWALSFFDQKNLISFMDNLSFNRNVTHLPNFITNEDKYTLQIFNNNSFKTTNFSLNYKKNLYTLLQKTNLNYSSSYNTDNFNLNFIKKEYTYTKLKYSRTPGYDIVSGGSAVILAGFLGFLVSEKFGIELVDSGDFYYLWMYIVFLCFSVRPLLITSSENQSILSLLSLRYIFNFLILLLNLLLKLIKRLYRF